MNNYMHKEIMLSGDEENIPHLSHDCQPFSEGPHHIAGIYLQADGNDRLQGASNCLWVDVGIKASDHTFGYQFAHTTQAR